jgi:hypothetical protein
MTTDIGHTTKVISCTTTDTSHMRSLITSLKVVPLTLITLFRRVQVLFSKMKTAMKSQGMSFSVA